MHSPFIYDLVTKCFYDKTTYEAYTILEKYRQHLLNDEEIITVTDFGSGSRVFKSNQRKVAAIAKNAGISPKRSQLLYRLVNYFQPKNILEIGTSLGIASSAMSLGNPKAKIITLEGCPETSKVAKDAFDTFGLQNVELITTKFEDFFTHHPQPNTQHPKPKIHHPTPTYDLIYFDGNHQKEATLDYFDTLLPTIHNDSVWVFDDIHWSAGMEEAWEKIKAHPSVTVTIDSFYWGLVFFRKEQRRQDFVIRV
ncbi:O-methyltransferase [Sungkyunkwania multivorans]|uniref:O-methyltransferase n=1 Tax=Sungkyunkwania multivorans TaxID=1173618 RepID=UPI0036D9DBEA